jgi:hypothetical protein
MAMMHTPMITPFMRFADCLAEKLNHRFFSTAVWLYSGVPHLLQKLSFSFICRPHLGQSGKLNSAPVLGFNV